MLSSGVGDVLRTNISSEQSTSHNFFVRSDDGINAVTAETSYLLEGGEVRPGNSPSVVFSLWSTMIGSTLLAMPRIVRDTGVVSALAGTVIVCCSNGYTVLIMEKLGRFHNNDGTALLKDAGKHVYLFATLVSVVVLLSANTIYQIYICDALMKLSDISVHNAHYRPIFAVSTAAVFFVVGLLKTLKPLFQAASYAIIVVMFVIGFIVAKALDEIINRNQCHQTVTTTSNLLWQGFGPFVENCSSMSLSLYIHSLVLPILSLATRPKNNPRDLIITFAATATSIVGPAALAAYGFRHCHSISSDFLDMFDDVPTTIARVSVITLVGIVYPILLYNARNQLLGVITGRDTFPYWAHIAFNLCAIALSTIPSALNISTTRVTAIAGVCAIMWVTFLPVGMWWLHVKRREPERLTLPFYVIHVVVLLFGCVLVAATIVSQASNVLN